MKLAYILMALILVGCANNPKIAAKQKEFDSTIPTCIGPEDCAAKWDAAQLWVVKNSGFKIQTLSNVLIETFNPPEYSPRLAAQVTKEPLGGGSYKLVVNLWCRNFLGCQPDAMDMELKFNQDIGRITP